MSICPNCRSLNTKNLETRFRVVSLTLSIRTRLTFRTHQGEENVLTAVKDIPQENTISLILLPLQNCQSYKELMTLCPNEYTR